MRESFIFYKSFYDSIKELDPKDQVLIYNAIFEHQFYGNETELNSVSKSIFKLIIPLLEANNKRYENGKKGGAPKGNQNARKNNLETTKNNQKQPKNKVMYNDNVLCIMNNELCNNVDDDIYRYVEDALGRTLNGIEYEEISKWDDNELTRYAIKQATLNGGRSIKYIQTILNSYKAKGILTVEDAIRDSNKRKKNTPEWFDKQYVYEKTDDKEAKELENLLKEFN